MDDAKRLEAIEFVSNLLENESINERNKLLDSAVASIPICRDVRTLKVPPASYDFKQLYSTNISARSTSLQFNRELGTARIIGFEEVLKPPGVVNPLCSRRASQRTTYTQNDNNDIRGAVENVPFLPGGLKQELEERMKNEATKREKILNFNADCLLTCAPGLPRGLKLDTATKTMDDFLEAPLPDDLSGKFENKFKVEKHQDSCQDVAEEKDEALDEVLKGHVADHAVNKLEVISADYPHSIWVDVNESFDDFNEKVPLMAHKYPFELDTFQKRAVYYLERGDNVFVAAHTSAGKTVVAEYAISMCKQRGTRTIYTSPIKALSNQKFRDFKVTFGDVGLITGDIQLHPEAFCLIMTTEILRSMLYNGSEVIKELEFVIFDEVHYINDIERGHVWEEVLIMLPGHVKIILLSATVPNTLEFADWIGQIKDKKVYVISTPKRPVPLKHYLYTGRDGGSKNNRYVVMDESGHFLNKGFNDAQNALKQKEKNFNKNFGAKGAKLSTGNPKTDRNIWITVISHLEEKEKLPVVCFTFSTRRCDENASLLTSIDLTTKREKAEVHHFFTRCINRLKASDRKLPQIVKMQDLAKRGIAVHHSGVLPILKEIVEMLFQKGCIKVLFATETFAMGVNMPARTVVFDAMRKFDGHQFRDLLPGEYIQMAGRAGRRGLDPTGTVILLIKAELPEISDLHKMLMGKPTKLESQFRVTYSMILNLLRVEQFHIEDMLQRSFAEQYSYKNLQARKEELNNIKTILAENKPIVQCQCCLTGEIERFCKLSYNILTSRQTLQAMTNKELDVAKMGRLLVISHGQRYRNWPAVLLRQPQFDRTTQKRTLTVFVVRAPPPTPAEVKLYGHAGVSGSKSTKFRALVDLALHREKLRPGALNIERKMSMDTGGYEVIDICSDDVILIGSSTVRIQPDCILADWKKRQQPRTRHDSPDRSVDNCLELLKKQLVGKDLVTLSTTTQFNDASALVEYQRYRDSILCLRTLKCVECGEFSDHFCEAIDALAMKERYSQLKFSLSNEGLKQNPDYISKLQVLKSLGYVDSDTLVTLKGKVACRVHHQELLITEMICDNVFSRWTTAEVAAALSATTCQQKAKEDDLLKLNPLLNTVKNVVEETTKKIMELQKKHNVLDNDLDGQLNYTLMQVVYDWSRGMPFTQITDQTDVQEGNIVRCIQRIDELCRDVKKAAVTVGDPTLERKMEHTSLSIKRDIVFAASLYTVE